VALAGIRKARYTGIGKVHLKHAFDATAVSMTRLDAWGDRCSPATHPDNPPRTPSTSPWPHSQNGQQVVHGLANVRNPTQLGEFAVPRPVSFFRPARLGAE
jgi:hypothetical protein